MVKRVLVIYNPVSKSQLSTEEWIGRLVAELNKSEQYLVSFFATSAHTRAEDLIPFIEEPLDLIIAAGGDGTLRFALAAVAQAASSIPVAVFPIGTGNVMARNIGIVEKDLMANPLKRVYDYILNGFPMRIDMAMMNGEYFAGMTGVGPIAEAFMLPERKEKNSSKLIAYMKSLLTSIAMPRRSFKITSSGGSFRVQASGIFLSNVEDLGIGKESDLAVLSDGLLDLHIVNPVCFGDFWNLVRRYGRGEALDFSADLVFRVREAVVEVLPRKGIRSSFQNLVRKCIEFVSATALTVKERSRELPCMIDGDRFGFTPMRVTVIPKAVNLWVPQELQTQIQPYLLKSEIKESLVRESNFVTRLDAGSERQNRAS